MNISKIFPILFLLTTILNLAHPAFCNDAPASTIKLKLVPAFPQLKFEQPLDFQSPSDGSNRIFIAEQKGAIKVFDNSPESSETTDFLDIKDKVFCGHSEEGLLGFVFHPQFKKNGFFYVYYTLDNPRRSRVARFTRSEKNPNQADPQSEIILFEQLQPFGNHKGGQLVFGLDGYLYVSLGDGGSGGDPYGAGQNRKVLLGKILRLDVDHPRGKKNYGIPADNPFVGNNEGFREEIFAYGLRNTWRFSVDPVTGKIWGGDVGQDKPREEIDIIENGKNYGWNIMEGTHCYNPAEDCDRNGLTLPVIDYSSDQGRSVTGGHVYRGKEISNLAGWYLYADFVSGRVWRLSADGEEVKNEEVLHNPNLYPSSFGVDQNRELYICSFDGSIYKFQLE